LIKELGKSKTVILSTHILQEVEAICSQVLIINDGRIVVQGKPEEIAGSMKGGDTWELLLKGADSGSSADSFADGVKGKIAELGQVSNVLVETKEGGLVSASFFVQARENGDANGDTNDGEQIFDWAVNNRYKILGMNRKKLSIEDIFVKLTSDESKSDKSKSEGAQQ